MSRTFQDVFHAAIKHAVSNVDGEDVDIAEVIAVEEEADRYGGCPTCGPGEVEYTVKVRYLDSEGQKQHIDLSGSLADLIAEVADYTGWSEQ